MGTESLLAGSCSFFLIPDLIFFCGHTHHIYCTSWLKKWKFLTTLRKVLLYRLRCDPFSLSSHLSHTSLSHTSHKYCISCACSFHECPWWKKKKGKKTSACRIRPAVKQPEGGGRLSSFCKMRQRKRRSIWINFSLWWQNCRWSKDYQQQQQDLQLAAANPYSNQSKSKEQAVLLQNNFVLAISMRK